MDNIPGIKELKDICYPDESRKKDIYRKLGIYAVKPMLHMGITPNMVTLARTILLVLGLWLLSRGIYTKAIIAAIIFELCIFLDTFDGAIARFKKMSSKMGEYMDFLLDHIASTVIYFIGVATFLYTTTQDMTHIYLGLTTILITQLFFIQRIIYRIRELDVDRMRKESRLFSYIYQDNNRLFVNLLLIAAITKMLYPLSLLFAAYAIAKLITIGLFFAQEKKECIFSFKNMVMIVKGLRRFI